LLVRLPNHLGDTIMALPALQRLADSGCALTLAGRAWAGSLLAAYPWRVLPLPLERWPRWRALRAALAQELRADAALLLTNSLSSALEMRLLNVPATGYASDARGWLLRKAVAIPPRWSAMQMHMVEYYDTLAGAWLGQRARPTPTLQLELPPAARAQAAALLRGTGINGEYVLLHGRSFRNYGEMASTSLKPNTAKFADVLGDFRSGTNHVKLKQKDGTEVEKDLEEIVECHAAQPLSNGNVLVVEGGTSRIKCGIDGFMCGLGG